MMASSAFDSMDTSSGGATTGRSSPQMSEEGSEEEEVERLTPAELETRLDVAWTNEKLAPELLPPLQEEFDVMLEVLRNQEKNMGHLEKSDVRLAVHKLEVDRIRSQIASYTRIRLAKIQEYCWNLKEKEDNRDPQSPSLLTPQEEKFLKDYIELVEAHLKKMGTQHMPKTVEGLGPSSQMTTSANLDTFVFLRVPSC